jgi:hypothetical protein
VRRHTAIPFLSSINLGEWQELAAIWQLRAKATGPHRLWPDSTTGLPDASQRHLSHRDMALALSWRRKHRRGWPGRRNTRPGHHVSSSPRLKQRGTPPRTLRLKARRRERVRCSSLVDCPVYPRLRDTMQASTRSCNKPMPGRNFPERPRLGTYQRPTSSRTSLARSVSSRIAAPRRGGPCRSSARARRWCAAVAALAKGQPPGRLRACFRP